LENTKGTRIHAFNVLKVVGGYQQLVTNERHKEVESTCFEHQITQKIFIKVKLASLAEIKISKKGRIVESGLMGDYG